MEQEIKQLIATKLNLQKNQVSSTLKMLEEGNTVPFIARYRKDATNGLKDFEVFDIEKQFHKIQEIEKRKATILKTIQDLGELTPAIKQTIINCWEEKSLEDIYLPFKPKRKTKAQKARELGLEGLAKIIMSQKNQNCTGYVQQFCTSNLSEDDALLGATDIMAEWISERSFIRNKVRNTYQREALLEAKVKKGKELTGEKFKDYFKFSALAKRLPSHRVLAILRGECEKVLGVSLKVDKVRLLDFIKSKTVNGNGQASDLVSNACEEAYKRLIKPSIEVELMTDLKTKADAEAIKVFSANLKQLLMIPPLGEKNILAIDPGFKTGCKIVCLDKQGNLKHNETIFPHAPQKKFKESISKISSLVNAYKIDAIAIGNGTASRETENLVKKVHFSQEVDVFVVSESGASIYSASKVGREEFPNHDVTVRGSISIGRRLLDPLAELVKIDAKSIGVGQYQHDVDQTMLRKELDYVVESCVNSVGVNVNTASPHLLKYIAGIGETLAQKIVEYRKEHGDFNSRMELKNVARLGGKAFEQSAGFLRIPNGNNPLDNSAVHPENYKAVERIAQIKKVAIEALLGDAKILEDLKADQVELGAFAFQDLLDDLSKQGYDPRKKIRKFEFDRSIESIQDLKIGMELPGLVENITNFGAFINIGIKEKGLVHVSEIANQYVSNPHAHLALNDYVKARIISIDLDRKRIGLSLKQE
jgi:uncharacterized protein